MSEGEDVKNVWNQVENRTPVDLRFHLLGTVVTSFRSRLRSGSGIERKDAKLRSRIGSPFWPADPSLTYKSSDSFHHLLERGA